MKIDLQGMNILVTGASRGIGRAIAATMANAGAAIAIHCKQNKEKAQILADEIGNGSTVFTADLADPYQCQKLFDQVWSHYHNIHVLVNNAGVFLDAPLIESSDQWLQKWRQTLDINLTAAALLTKLFIQHAQSMNGGRIINISSRAAFRGDDPNYLAYAASKGGMVSLTRSIARGFGKNGIKAFLVAPGFVETDMAQSFFNAYGKEPVLQQLALTEITQPYDVANIVAFLASGLADHATGCTIDINAASYVH